MITDRVQQSTLVVRLCIIVLLLLRIWSLTCFGKYRRKCIKHQYVTLLDNAAYVYVKHTSKLNIYSINGD